MRGSWAVVATARSANCHIENRKNLQEAVGHQYVPGKTLGCRGGDSSRAAGFAEIWAASAAAIALDLAASAAAIAQACAPNYRLIIA